MQASGWPVNQNLWRDQPFPIGMLNFGNAQLRFGPELRADHPAGFALFTAVRKWRSLAQHLIVKPAEQTWLIALRVAN
jgi:hypothetical protein